MTEQLDLFETSIQEEEKRPQESELTPRQWSLYRLIYHNSMVEHRKTTQKEIYDKVQGYEWSESNNTSDHCSAIWTDVATNNLSLEHDGIIITEKYVYWIGSKRETKKFLQKLWRDLSPRLKRYWNYVKKVGYDGQGKLYDKNLNPIDENSKAKMFHDSFNDYDINMQEAIDKSKEEDEALKKENKNDIHKNQRWNI